MTNPMEAVQVQLVNPWWEQIIPVAALLISVSSVALTLVFRYFDRLDLRVKVAWSPVLTSSMQPFTGQDRVTVEVTNHSRTATTEVSVLTLRSSEKKALGADASPWQPDSRLPISLGPGQTALRSYSAQRVGDSLNTDAAQGVTWVQGMATSGHKTVHGKRRHDLVTKLRDYARSNATG